MTLTLPVDASSRSSVIDFLVWCMVIIDCGRPFGCGDRSWDEAADVAKHLGVAKDSIYRWIEHRGLPAHKIGRLWKFKLSAVDVWVRAGGAEGSDEENGRGR